jgi:hypothetical protein
MVDPATDPGGHGREVPRTTAAVLQDLHHRGREARGAFMGLLAERYGKTVYHYLRMSRGTDSENARELTQAFFAWLLEGDHLGAYDPARSSFRLFLRGILGDFAGHEPEALLLLKRDGPVPGPVGAMDFESPGPATDPEEAFEAVFLRDAVDRAVGRVRARFQSRRRTAPFLAFELYHLSKGVPSPTYAQVAHRLGIESSDVRHYLGEVREEVEREVRAEFEADGGGIPEEVASLFK